MQWYFVQEKLINNYKNDLASAVYNTGYYIYIYCTRHKASILIYTRALICIDMLQYEVAQLKINLTYKDPF